jgi:hypothetical protein
MAASWRILWSVLFLAAFVRATASSRAEDWPEWGGTPGHNMVSNETGLPEFFRPGKTDSATDAVDPASG